MARSVAGPVGVALLAALAWLIVDPPSTDLAAQEYRAELFRDAGFVTTSPDWYGGFEVPGYSLLFPPLAAFLGVKWLGVLCAVAAAAIFALIAERYAGRAGQLAAYWFAVAISTQLVTGRITFALGVALGLGAVCAIQRRSPGGALGLAAASSAASPVAGVFVALAGTAVAAAAGPDSRRQGNSARVAGLAAAAGAGLTVVVMSIAWPSGGVFPFETSAFVAIPLFAAAGLLFVPASMRALRFGIVLYGVLGLAVFAVDNPFGANATRLGALFGGPVLALALWPAGNSSRKALAALALPLLYWQWVAPVDSLISSTPDELRDPARSAPLLEQIDDRADALAVGFRVHVPPTRTRWEAKHVAERFPIARGWLRQLESDDFDLFTGSRLTAASYRAWLDDHDVALVAVPDAEPDYLAEDERELIASGLSYLDPIWSNPDWVLYRVTGAGRS